MPEATSRRAPIAIEILVVGLGAWAVWLGMRGQRHFEVPVLPCVAAALVLGGLARALSPWAMAARALTGLAVVLAVGVAAEDTWYFHWNDVGFTPSFAWLAWLATLFAPLALGVVGLRLGERSLAFVVGVALAAHTQAWNMGYTPVLIMLVFTVAARAGGAWSDSSLRERVTLVPLGALTMLATLGLLHDAAMLGHSLEIEVNSSMYWVEVDSPSTFILRCTAEALAIVGGLAMARGKTAGLLLLVIGVPLLLPSLLPWTDLPAHGSGCMVYSHPFEWEGRVVVSLAAALAIIPWLRPLWSHLVARRSAPAPA